MVDREEVSRGVKGGGCPKGAEFFFSLGVPLLNEFPPPDVNYNTIKYLTWKTWQSINCNSVDGGIHQVVGALRSSSPFIPPRPPNYPLGSDLSFIISIERPFNIWCSQGGV